MYTLPCTWHNLVPPNSQFSDLPAVGMSPWFIRIQCVKSRGYIGPHPAVHCFVTPPNDSPLLIGGGGGGILLHIYMDCPGLQPELRVVDRYFTPVRSPVRGKRRFSENPPTDPFGAVLHMRECPRRKWLSAEDAAHPSGDPLHT